MSAACLYVCMYSILSFLMVFVEHASMPCISARCMGQDVSTVRLSDRGNTRLDPDHKNHADSTKHKSDLLKICSSLNELHCAKGLSS